jgi:uncharacterized NAD(P)/FAD-binding protein YdhS
LPPAVRAGHLRVAIVGLGPKGLFALERLLDHARRCDALLDVDLFEPHAVPGAGPVYDPAQPDYLLMNFAADQLDMWCADSVCVPRSQRLSFVDWRRRAARRDDDDHGDAGRGRGEASRGRGAGDDGAGSGGSGEARYPPRAQVGRYLSEGFELLRSRLPEGSRLTLRPLAVDAVRRGGPRWRVVAADGSTRDYDEVLVATGHRAPSWTGADGEHAAPVVRSVFPVASQLSRAALQPGAAVAVRGFALTFIDAALALTEGRGGSFASAGHPYRLRYVPSPSGEEPKLIRPFSRSGRPMLAKPEAALAVSVPSLGDIARHGRDRILALASGFSLDEDLLGILASTSGACLLAATGRRPSGEDLLRGARDARRWLAAAACGAAPAYGHQPAIELERSLAVGAGLHPPDLQWALGQCWRGVYPALVARLSDGGLPAGEWPAFHRLAGQLERVAFGPPPENAAKLLALIAAGRVDLTHVAGGVLTTDAGVTSLRSARGAHPVDVIVNAVLAEPGARGSAGGLLGQLVRDGYARIVPGQRGLEVTTDASCLADDGLQSAGLAAIGRPTEDSVIGNDTLSRSLHPHADRWARRVALRAAVPVAADRPRDAAPAMADRPREAA